MVHLLVKKLINRLERLTKKGLKPLIDQQRRVDRDHFNLHKKLYVNILDEQFEAAMKDIERCMKH